MEKHPVFSIKYEVIVIFATHDLQDWKKSLLFLICRELLFHMGTVFWQV